MFDGRALLVLEDRFRFRFWADSHGATGGKKGATHRMSREAGRPQGVENERPLNDVGDTDSTVKGTHGAREDEMR